MLPRFVQVSNVKRFIRATETVKAGKEGAPEACITLVTGYPGFGKTGTVQWWATQNNAVYLRLKAAATPHWALTDLVKELGESAPATSCEKLYGQAFGYLSKNARPIVVDEIENGLANIKVLETIRDLSDCLEIQVIFAGREYCWGRLKRYGHFRTRIGDHAVFHRASLLDVRLCADQLLTLKLADDLVAEIHDKSEGQLREVIKMLRQVEMAVGGRTKKDVSREDMKAHPLMAEPQRAPQLEKAG